MSENAAKPAFPFDRKDFQPDTWIQVTREQFPGLTKREEFAKAAMQGMVALGYKHVSNEKFLVSRAVSLADALLAELEKTP